MRHDNGKINITHSAVYRITPALNDGILQWANELTFKSHVLQLRAAGFRGASRTRRLLVCGRRDVRRATVLKRK